MTLKPQALKKGDTIGVISPAGPLSKTSIEEFQNGILKLRNLGYNVIFGKYTYYDCGYLAANDRQRADDLMNMFSDKEVTSIFCSRGGYGTERLIDYIDLEVIKKNPKIFVGYSNITFLLNVFYQFSNLITFHGPMVKEFASNKHEYNFHHLMQSISFKREAYAIPNTYHNNFKCLVQGKVKGNLIGGNLSTLICTLGTKFEIDTKDKILLLEDIDEPAYSVDRMLTHLRNSGKLADCSGIILGDFTNCEDSNGVNIETLFKDIFSSLGKPIVYNINSGHGYYNFTLPIGAEVEIDTTNKSIIVCEPVIN